jgi:hypothetical protein
MRKSFFRVVSTLSIISCLAFSSLTGIEASAEMNMKKMALGDGITVESDEEPEQLFKVGDVFTYDQIVYKVLSISDSSSNRGTVEAIGYESGVKDINIPLYVSSYQEEFKFKITAIAPAAFKNCKSATNFWLSPDSPIKKIPNSMCEGCSKLVIAQLRGKKLTTIGKKAFFKCGKLNITQIYSTKVKKWGKKSFKKTKKGMHLQVNGVDVIKKYTDKCKKSGAKNVNCYAYDDF